MTPLRLPFQNYTPDTAPYYAAGENTAQNCLPYLAAPNYTQSPSIALSAIGNINGSPYVVNAVADNATAYLTRGAALTGITNTKQGTLSAWIRIDALPVSIASIFEIFNAVGGSGLLVFINNLGGIAISASNSANTAIMSLSTNVNYSANKTWLNILASWDLNASAHNLYINNTSVITVNTFTNDTISYNGTNSSVCALVNGLDNFNGAFAELWFTNSYFDLSSAPNRAKFIDGSGFPVNLGSTGQTPTGTSPLVYLKSAAGTCGTNSGTGGNFTQNGTFAIASSSPSDSTPTQYIGAASFIDSTGAPHTYAGTSNKIAEITATTANNVSKAGGYNATGSWEFTGFTAAGIDNVYATDFNDAIQVMAVGGTAFADLAGGPPKAKHICTIGQFVLALNTTGGTYGGGTAGAVPNRVQWCQIGNPANWPDPLTLTGIADQAGVEDLPLVYGAVQHGSNGQLYGLVFQENAISNFYYVGGNVVFQVNTYEKQRGCYCPNGCVQVGDIVYFIHSSGFFATDGATVQPIGHDMVDNTWLADVNTAYISNVRGSHDVQNKCIWWTYPSLTATLQGGFVVCDKVIVYNYADKRWAMGMVGQSIDILFSSYTLGYTMEQLDIVNSNLDLITPSLDSPFWNGGVPVVGVFGIQQIGTSGTYASYVGSFSGTPLTATIDTKEMQLNPGGLALVNTVNPVVMGATLSGITVAPITRNTLSDAPVTGPAAACVARTGKAPMRSNARYHRFRTVIAGGFTNAMGVEPEATPSGSA